MAGELLFTTDHRDFEVYRAGGHRRFQILPSPEIQSRV